MLRGILMKKLAILVSTFALAVSCQHGKHKGHHDKHHGKHHHHKHDENKPHTHHPEKDVVKFGDLETKKFKHMHFSGAPTNDQIKIAKEKGVTVLIDVRNKSELTGNEATYAQSLGMKYYNIPLLDPKTKKISKENFKKIEKLHAETHGEQQLVYCKSGNRASAWFAAHVALKHKKSPDEAVEVGQRFYLKSTSMVKDFVQEKQ